MCPINNHLWSIVSYATEVRTDFNLQQEILQCIHAGLGDTLQSQSIGGHQGQNKTRKKISKDTIGLECVLTLPTTSDAVTNTRRPSLSISRKCTPSSKQHTSPTKLGETSE